MCRADKSLTVYETFGQGQLRKFPGKGRTRSSSPATICNPSYFGTSRNKRYGTPSLVKSAGGQCVGGREGVVEKGLRRLPDCDAA